MLHPRSRPRTALAALLPLLLAPLLAAGDELPPLATELVVDGLNLPTFVTAPPGDDRLFVLEQNTGRVRLVQDGAILPQPFLDLGTKLQGGGEQGLLGLAFHPQLAADGRVFVTYNDLEGDVVLESYVVDPSDPNRALPDSGQVLLEVPKPFSQHNGGMIAFSPLDGMLLMSLGDGGAGGDPFDNAQDLTSLLGKLLRLDVDGDFPYAIPADNPFVGVGGGVREEIYAYGLRNPWRWSFDSRTGAILIADVGQQEREEIDLIRGGSPGGQNFGWRCAEGTLCTHLGDCACPEPGTVAPIHEFTHDDGCAVVGGYRYNGAALPGFRGRYVFGDYCTSRVWSFAIQGGQVSGEVVEHTLELNPPGGTLGFISSFGVDGQGELLVVGHAGAIRRVVPPEPDPDCDGDGVTDAEEIAAGTAFDVNRDGKPDDCQLLLTSTELVGGQPATLSFLGAAPGQPLAWFVSTRGIGNGPCFFGGALCLDLLPFSLGGNPPEVLLLGLTPADTQGAGSFTFKVPAGPIPGSMGEVSFQAVAVAGALSVKSNPIQKVVTSP